MFHVLTRTATPVVSLFALFGLAASSPDLSHPLAFPQEPQGFVELFNGKDLTGWQGDTKLWTVRDGMIVGKSPGIDHNEFLATKETFGDFILQLAFRLVGGAGNSGVQFRSRKLPNSPQVSGYQADIGDQYWGSLYDEARRNQILVDGRKAGALEAVKKDGWNEYAIRCEGDHIILELNGVKTADYREPDANIPQTGIIALQIHGGKPQEVPFKNIRSKKLGP
jgi:hypothetical protein